MPAPVRAPELDGRGGWIGVERPLSMAALRGRAVLVYFWAGSSIASQRLLDELRPLEDLFAGQLVVVGVHAPRYPAEADHGVAEAAVARYGIAHPVLDDSDLRTWAAYGVREWPTVVLVGPDGDLYGSLSGEDCGDGCGALLETTVRELLEAAPEPPAGRRRRKVPAATRTLLPDGPLAFPGKVACSADGRRLAVADTANDRVLVCSLDGVVLEAHTGFLRPQGVRFDAAGDVDRPDGVMVCDTGADRVVRTNGEVVADSVLSPWDLVGDGRSWVIAEAGGHRLVRVRPGELRVRLVAGTGVDGDEDGPADKAELSQPSGVAMAATGLVFVDAGTSSLRLVTEVRRGAEVSTLVSGFQYPLGVAADPRGGPVYVADTFNSSVRVWDGATLTTLPVQGLDQPGGLDLLPDGRLVVADTGNHRVVVVDPGTGRLEPVELDETWVHGTDGPPVRLTPGGSTPVQVAIDLVDEQLEPAADGTAPVRVVVESRPSSLLGAGAQEWALGAAGGAVEVTGGAEGSGLLLVEVTARTRGATGPAVRVQRRRHVLDVVPPGRLAPD